MGEYSLGFSEQLVNAATFIDENDIESLDAKRTVLYLSLLSCEITMKASLEKAGKPVEYLKKLSHKLEELLNEFSNCEIKKEVGKTIRWLPATSIRAQSIELNGKRTTTGKILCPGKAKASNYPNEIRYGDKIIHYPPKAVLEVAKALKIWANDHWADIRLKK